MNRPGMQVWTRSLLLSMFLVAALLGCKQGEGQVCQIDSDCEEDLECNAGTRRCQQPGTGSTADAAPLPDANTAASLDYDVETIEPQDDNDLERTR